MYHDGGVRTHSEASIDQQEDAELLLFVIGKHTIKLRPQHSSGQICRKKRGSYDRRKVNSFLFLTKFYLLF